jgi:hypothetical protein
MQPTQPLRYSPPGYPPPVSYARSIGDPEPDTHVNPVYSELDRAGKLNYLSHAHRPIVHNAAAQGVLDMAPWNIVAWLQQNTDQKLTPINYNTQTEKAIR